MRNLFYLVLMASTIATAQTSQLDAPLKLYKPTVLNFSNSSSPVAINNPAKFMQLDQLTPATIHNVNFNVNKKLLFKRSAELLMINPSTVNLHFDQVEYTGELGVLQKNPALQEAVRGSALQFSYGIDPAFCPSNQ
ncbi:MAG: hypothetical protein WBA16_10655 [Nonlabens sp.]